MRKIFSFFAFVAIVLSFAACGGNTPEVKNFQIKVQALSEHVHIVITPPANNQREYYFWLASKKQVEEKGSVRAYAEYDLSLWPYNELKEKHNLIQSDKVDYWSDEAGYSVNSNTPHVLYVCFVEKEGDYAKIVGDIEYVEFTTMPKNTLNGEFSVSATKKVHFSQATLRNKNGSYYFFDNQWNYSGSMSNFPIDLFQWNAITYCPSPFYVLSKDEWWYMLKTRPNADKLFAPAIVNGAKGLILLPDNWQTPDDVQLITADQMGIVWNNGETRYEHSETDYDGYGRNIYNIKKWKVMEYAGAVFMPATWSSNNYGWYWTSTDEGDNAYEFYFGGDCLVMSYLTNPQTKADHASFRLVRDVE